MPLNTAAQPPPGFVPLASSSQPPPGFVPLNQPTQTPVDGSAYTSKYQSQIVAAALRYGVSPSTALAVHRMEDPADNPTIEDYKKSDHIGMFQMSKGAWADVNAGDPAGRTDPLKNIDAGVRYIAHLKQQNGGDENKAIQHFGDGTPQYLQQYQAYRSQYDDIALSQSGHPVEAGIPVPPVVGQVFNDHRSLTHRANAAFGKPMAREGKKVVDQVHQIVKDHPSMVEHISNFLSAPQRGAAGAYEWFEKHPEAQNGGILAHPEEFTSLVKQAGNWFLHAEYQPEANKVDRTALSLGHGGFLPTDEQIDSHLHGLSATVARTAADTLSQALVDPTMVVPVGKALGLVGREAKLTAKAYAEVAGHVSDAINHVTTHNKLAAKLFGPTHAAAQGFVDETKEAVHGALSWFAKRPDLDQHLSPQGKKAFFGITTSQANAHAERMGMIRKNSGDPSKLVTDVANMYYEHGDAKMRAAITKSPINGFVSAHIKATAAGTEHLKASPAQLNQLLNDMKTMNPEERVAALEHVSNTIKASTVRSGIRGLAAEPDRFLSPSSLDAFYNGGQQAWHTVADSVEHDHVIGFVKEIQKSWYGKLTGKIARASTKTLAYANPLLHPVKNVGKLAAVRAPVGGEWSGARVAGGTQAVMTGIMHGLTFGRFVPKAQLIRMGRKGARSEYYSQIFEKMPKYPLNPVTYVAPVLNWLQRLGTHVEDGYRASMLAQLDHHMGPSTSDAVEYLKGQIVNERAGDYHNVSQFAQAFKAIGGPFVAFRLGIVPEQMVKGIFERPDRVNTLYHNEINANEENKKGGGHGLWMVQGGPEDDMADLAANTPKYLTSQASLGIAGDVFNAGGTGIAQRASHQSVQQTVLDTVFTIIDAFNPGLGAILNLANLNPDYDTPKNESGLQAAEIRELGEYGVRSESKTAEKTYRNQMKR